MFFNFNYEAYRGHSHSTKNIRKLNILDSEYAQRGRGGVKPNAYDCVQGGVGV